VLQDAWQRPPLEGPVYMTMIFELLRPKSVKPERRPWPHVAPDLDKLVRAVSDAMTGIVYRDDAQLVSGTFEKRYGDVPGVQISVTALESSA